MKRLLVLSLVVWGSVFGAEWTDDDFSGGILENVQIKTVGTETYLQLAERSGPWLTNWGYRRPITINNSGTQTLFNYQIAVRFFNGDSIYSHGGTSSLRVTDSNGTTTLPLWTENWNTSGTSTIWTKLNLPLGTKTIYVYYGNQSATSTSNFDAVFTKDYGESGLVGLWHMDEGSGIVVADLSGQGNDGAIAPWVVGTRTNGTALSFDGSNDYINVGNSTDFSFGTGDFTITAWFKPTVISNNIYSIVGKDSNISARQWNFYICDKLMFYSFPSPQSYVYSTNDVTINQWNYGVVTRQSGTMTIYINGQLEGSNIITADFNSTISAVNIGRREHSYDHSYFPGIIDEVCIYKRALSPEEIQQRYQGMNISTENLVSEWRFEEGAIDPGTTTVYDSVGTNHGTMYNFPSPAQWVGTDGGQWDGRSDVKFGTGSCLSFNGTNNYVNCGSNDSLTLANNMAIEIWFKWDGVTGGPLIDKRQIGKDNNFMNYGVWIQNNGIYFIISNGVGSAYPAGVIPTPNVWHQVVGVYEYGVQMRLYLDGVLRSSINTSIVPYTSGTHITYLGQVIPAWAWFFKGSLDEPRIYNRALPAEEIRAHYERRKYAHPEPATATGTEEGLYLTNGTFTSSPCDTTKKSDFGTLSIVATTTPQCGSQPLKFQVSVDSSPFSGPSGGGSYYIAPASLNKTGNSITYKALLQTNDSGYTPNLDRVSISHSIIPIISVLPNSGRVGDAVTVIGEDFTEGVIATIDFGIHPAITTTLTSSSGSFSAIFSLDTQPGGTKTITATDTSNKQATTLLYLIPQYTLSVSSTHGTPIPSIGTHIYNSGDQITASVTSPVIEGNTRYICTGWQGTGSVPYSGTTTELTFNITENSEIAWLWKTEYYLTTSANPSGDGIVTPSSGWYEEQAIVNIQAIPNTGYIFISWTGSLTGQTNPATITMNAPKTVVGNFGLTQITLLSPTSGKVGTEITVEGINFKSSSEVTISFGAHSAITTATSDQNGGFSANFIVDTQAYGLMVITAEDGTTFATTTFLLISQAVLYIAPEYKLLGQSSTFTLSLRIDEIENMSVAELYLSFDPAILSIEKITKGGFPPAGWMTQSFDNSSGKADIGVGINPMSSPAEGSGIFATITFLTKAMGTSAIKFDFTEPRRTKILSPETEIPVSSKDGMVEVSAPAYLIITPGSVTLMAGDTQGFSAQGYTADDSPIEGLAYTWGVEGGVGQVLPQISQETILYATTTAVSGFVTVQSNGVGTDALVYIIHNEATSLKITPEYATLTAGGTLTYTATGYDIYENGFDLTSLVTFTAQSGGSFTDNIFSGYYSGVHNVEAVYGLLKGIGTVTITPGLPIEIEKVSGDNQTRTATTTLTYPFVVWVKDYYGNPVNDVAVNWGITGVPELATGQKLSATETLTGVNGVSSTYLTLGDRQGTYTTHASSFGLTGSPISFSAYATPLYGSLTGKIKPVVYGTKTGVSPQYLSLPGILVELIGVGTTLTSADGGFIFKNILPGTYTLYADTYGASPGTKTNIPILPGKTTDLKTLTLLAGDASNDCEVTIIDFNLLAQAFLTSPTDVKWNPEADFDHSNRVDGYDFNILYKNYGLSHLGGGMGEIGGMEIKSKKAERAYKSIAARVKIYPETLSLKVGDTATWYCDIENVTDYFGADYWFSFDPNVLEITSVTWGGFPVDGWSVSDINNTNGTLFFNAAVSLGNPTVSGSGSLAIINVRGKGVGTTSLLYDFEAPGVTKMINMEGKDIPFNYNEPAVIVSESQSLFLTIVSGNNQQGEIGMMLPQPLTVRLSDGAGDPIQGETITFTMTEMPVGATGQVLSTAFAITDSDGLASTHLTPGNKAGTYTVSATFQGLSVKFYGFAKESATSATYLRILPSELKTTTSSTFTLSLYIEDVKNFSVGELYFSFDPALLSVESITKGDFPAGGWMTKGFDNNSGRIDIGFGINPVLSPAEGSGTVAKLTFLARSEGTVKLGFNQEEPRRTRILSPEEEMPYKDSGSTITISSVQTSTTLVKIDPEVTYSLGTFTVALVIDNVKDVMGASLRIGFDPDKLKACSVTEGDFLKQNAQTAFFTKIASNYIQIDTVRLSGNPLGATGTGVIATITFGLKAEDPSSTITLVSTLRDSTNKDIPHTDNHGLVRKGMLGDFDADDDIDFDDLMLFSLAWNNQSLAGDIGPADGTPPNLILHPDGVVDFEDLMIFSLMWNWYNGSGKSSALSVSDCGEIKIGAPKEGLRNGEVFEIPLSVESAIGVMGLSFILGFDPAEIEFVSATKGELMDRNGGQGVLLVKNENGRIKIDIAVLGGAPLGISGSGVLAIMRFKAISDEPEAGIQVIHTDARSLQNTTIYLPAQDVETKIPSQSSLLQSFPNPAGYGCWIPFQLTAGSDVSVEIYNVVGQRVKGIDAGPRKAGSYTQAKEGYAIFWNRTNDAGEKVSKGLYFYKLQAGKFSDVKSLVVE